MFINFKTSQNGFTQHHFRQTIEVSVNMIYLKKLFKSYKNIKHESGAGFIALMSAIIISVLLLAITVSLGFSGFFGRFNILDSESKERSSALAEACGDTAILKLAQDLSYVPNPAFNFTPPQTGGESITVGSDHCTIVSVDTSPSQKAIKTQAVINKAYTNLRIIIDSTNLTITSWSECNNLTNNPGDC